MKANKNFKVGDKVFAKMKGHSTWPAQVVGITGKSYKVKFYGTGETGSLKADGLFYYLQNKNRFKPLKRKTYQDAVEEIDKDILEAGGDGYDPNTNNDNSSNNNKKSSKRKRITSSNESLNSNKMSKINEDEERFTPDSVASSDKMKSESDQDDILRDEQSEDSQKMEETLPDEKQSDDETVIKSDDIQALDIKGSDDDAKSDATETKDDPEPEQNDSEKGEIASNMNASAIQEMTTQIDEKKELYETLLIENEMHNQIIGVMKCLRSNKSDPKEALRLLHSIYEMDVDAFLLKKQPYFMDTVHKLKRYVGNIASWNLNEIELKNFNEDTEKLRAFANKLFDKFKNVFPYKNDENFYQKYLDDVKRFKDETRHMSESQLLLLCREPYQSLNQCSKETCATNIEEEIYRSPTCNENVLVFTVATEVTDGFQRYNQSAAEYNIEPHVLGMGEEWKGGDNIKLFSGGGWKVNLLKNALEQYKNDENKIILFTDGYDVMFLSSLDKIVSSFKELDARILFGAEAACWPDKKLTDVYPDVKNGKRFLNSGLYMGYMKEMLQLLNYAPIKDKDDDQLFFTNAYLDQTLRKKLHFKLDHMSVIFQNMNGAINELEVKPEENKEQIDERFYVNNFLTLTKPLIIHANGPSKLHLNAFGNYLANAWNAQNGCKHCTDYRIDLSKLQDNELPIVCLSLFIETATPFLTEQLQKINALKYPKNRMHFFVHNNIKYHSDIVKQFVDTHEKDYLSIKTITPEDGINDWTARDLSLDSCTTKKCDYLFSVDSIAHLDNPHTLRLLIEQNRTIVAPLLARPGKAWSNFWGALTTDGFYARSNDYMDIVHNERRGLWNVPFVSNCYLINATLLKKYDRSKIHYSRSNLDSDMAICANLRDLDVFLFVSNRVDFGHLVNPETFDIALSVPDLYQIFENQKDWEERYIHADYPEIFNPDNKPKQPCTDVYWFPIVTLNFCKDLIHMVESFGKWSDGKNQDARLEGGYEAVPTRDIHMNQVEWERHWLYFLQQYIRPIQEYVFTGYFHDPPRSLMNFVVRYRPDEQPSLRPHHDSSTYTINIALNTRGVDYEGGGCKFLRYNCSVVDTKPGWLLMHPGRLTHYHEGLLVTKGTRYIMIAFVDP